MAGLAFDTASAVGRLPCPALSSRRRVRSVGPLALVVADASRCLAISDVDADQAGLTVILAMGVTRVRQGACAVELQPGEWTLARTGAPLTAEAQTPIRMVAVPRDQLAERGLALSQALLRRFASRDPVNRIVHTVFDALFDETAGLHPGEGADLAQAALQVLKNALARAGAYRPPKAVMADRVREFIDSHIRDPRLSPDQVARGLRCTPRHVHRAFEGQAETVGQYVLRRRLERCRGDLADPGLSQRSVTEIAFSWGFNNAAHFSRVFKRQFGCCPRACRPCARSLEAGRGDAEAARP